MENNKKLTTPLEYFYNWEKNTPDRIFLKQPFGDDWKTLTYAQAGEEARKMVSVLQNMGLKKGDHIFGQSRDNLF